MKLWLGARSRGRIRERLRHCCERSTRASTELSTACRQTSPARTWPEFPALWEPRSRVTDSLRNPIHSPVVSRSQHQARLDLERWLARVQVLGCHPDLFISNCCAFDFDNAPNPGVEVAIEPEFRLIATRASPSSRHSLYRYNGDGTGS